MDPGLIPWWCWITMPAALLLPLLVIFFFFIIKKSKPSCIKLLPPGPNPLPLIGNLHLISSPPFRSFTDLAKRYGPLMHLKLGEDPTIVVSSPEIAEEILKTNDPNFAERPGAIAINIMWYNYASIGFSQYGPYWRQMRKVCISELLNAKSVRSFGSIRNDEVSQLIKYIRLFSGKPINLSEKLSSMASSVTCRAAFGKVCKDDKAFMAVMREGVQMASGFLIADFFPSSIIVNTLSWPTKLILVMMRRKLNAILDDFIREHERNLAKFEEENGRGSSSRRGNGQFGDEDLVDVLLRIKECGDMEFPIGNDNIKAILFDMFTGGTEPSSATIDWIMTELIRNPGVMAKAQAEVRQVFDGTNNIQESDVHKLKYLKLVIREGLRLHPPIALLPRAARLEREINGYTIPAKAKVLVNIWAIQRDPKHWANPESFEPERFENQTVDFTGGDFEYLPFGSGKRMCPGMTFGLANLELPLAHLLYNFNWKLPDGVNAHDLDMTEEFGLAASRKQNLFLVATPYNPMY